MKEIMVIDKISDSEILVEYEDKTTETFEVKRIPTRKDAIAFATAKTKEALKKEDAFENLHRFINDFSRVRNYEIEGYIDWIMDTVGYRIKEICPINGFSWFG